MSGGSRGAARERLLASKLRDEGWWVKGTGDAHGAADLVALKAGEKPRLIQVKGNRSGGPYMNFRIEERLALLREADIAGAEAWLVYYPPNRKPPQWIHPRDWPKRANPEEGRTSSMFADPLPPPPQKRARPGV